MYRYLYSKKNKKQTQTNPNKPKQTQKVKSNENHAQKRPFILPFFVQNLKNINGVDTEKFAATFLIPKSDTKLLPVLNQAYRCLVESTVKVKSPKVLKLRLLMMMTKSIKVIKTITLSKRQQKTSYFSQPRQNPDCRRRWYFVWWLLCQRLD